MSLLHFWEIEEHVGQLWDRLITGAASKRYPLVINAKILRGDPSREPVFDNDKIAIAVRKGDPLTAKLNEALKAIVADGTYKEINDKYFPFSIY